MKKSVFHIAFLINMCCIANLGFSTNYYVDAVLGSDLNNGTSSDHAWKTIDKVNSIVFQPGDSILFHRGQSWTGNVFIDYTGSVNQPIVFSSYGQGEYPILKGSTESDSTNYWNDTGNDIWESSVTYNEEISVIFYNTNDALPLRANKESNLSGLDELWDFYYDPITHKVCVYSPADNPANIADGLEIVHYDSGIHIEDVCSHITISKLNLQYFTNEGIYAWNPAPGLLIDSTMIANIGGPGSDMFHGNGIYIQYLNSNDTITIINNETYNIWNIGIFVPAGPTTLSTLYGSRICNNSLSMTGGSAIGLRYAIGVDVSNNYIHKASVYIPDRCGIGLENCDFITVNNNTILEAVDDFSSEYSGWLSAGIYTFGASHSKFYYNKVSEGVVGIHLDNDDGTFGYISTGNEVCYNLCYNHYGIGIMIEQENDSTLVFNNTVYNCLHAGISFRGMWAGNSDHCSVKNNIVFNPETSNNVIEIADIGVDFMMDYNCFYHTNPSANLIHWLGNNYTSTEFNDYQDFSGLDSNSINDDPMFNNVNIDPFIFLLNSNSPCIDTGIDLGLNQDIIGHSVPYNALVDIGAYEYDINNARIAIQIKELSNLELFPNPCRGKVNVQFKSEIFGNVKCTLSNSIGSILYSAQESTKNGRLCFEIDLSGIHPGVYFVKIVTEDEMIVIRELIKL